MTIYCITHKTVPGLEGRHVVPIAVGPASRSSPYLRDSEGSDQIAERNANWCELTAQYWVWKNRFPAHHERGELVGFCHYRRHFVHPYHARIHGPVMPYSDFAGCEESLIAEPLMAGRCEALIAEALPIRLSTGLRPALKDLRTSSRLRRAGVSHRGAVRSVALHYGQIHRIDDLLAASELLPSLHRKAFLDHLATTDFIHGYNMYLAPVPVLEAYFRLLFDWMFKVEERLQTRVQAYDAYQRRIYGFLAERFSSYYFTQRVKSQPCPVVFTSGV